jgi:SAM-dependent methyltransferase
MKLPKFNDLLNKVIGKYTGVNSNYYWNSRFSRDWEKNNGRLQTGIYAAGFLMNASELDGDINSVLDYGCGSGDSFPFLKMKFESANHYYYDFSQTAMEKVAEYYAHIADPVEFPIKRTFELVYCSNVIEHLDNPNDLVDQLVQLSSRYVVIQAPFNERHSDGSIITVDRPKGEHFHTINLEFLNGVVSDFNWSARVFSVFNARTSPQQIVFIGERGSSL